MLNDKRVRIVTGHYGSGKTEFSLNYALKLREHYDKVAIVDLDIVNPYFRSVDREEMLKEMGIVVVSNKSQHRFADVPAVPPEILGYLQRDDYQVVIDVGGDGAGAKALGRFHRHINDIEHDMLFVINANRPFTKTGIDTLSYLRDIEDSCRVKATKLVNNTHLLRETSSEDILRGQALSEELSKLSGLPIAYVCGTKDALDGAKEDIRQGSLFYIDMQIRPSWL